MDLRRLRLFLAVVDEGGFTRAAQAEFVSQPSVSQAIRELEAELGTPLFHRVGRGVTLTAAGEALVGPARQTLRDVETARAAVAAVGGLEAGRLDLCALPTLAVDPVAPLTGAFRTAHPGSDGDARRRRRPGRGRVPRDHWRRRSRESRWSTR